MNLVDRGREVYYGGYFQLAVAATSMTEIMRDLISAIGGAGVALAIAAFLGRQWLRLQIDKALEAYKASLAQRAEVLKTELSIYAHEQNVGLTRIDAQRSEAILSLWAILSHWEEAFLDLTAPNGKLEADALEAIHRYLGWAQELMRLSDKLSVEVRNREILFDEVAYSTIARYGLAVSTVTNDFYAQSYEGIDISRIGDVNGFLARVREARDRLRESARNTVTELRRALSNEFRVLMRASTATANRVAGGF